MKKSQGYVYIATIFDTKRAEIFYVRDLIKNAANQIAGAVYFHEENTIEDKPAIGLTMFGVTTPCIQLLKALIM